MNLIPTVEIPVQSHSSLDAFANCPRAYKARYIDKSVKFKETIESRWGNNAHHHLEIFVASQGACPIPKQIHPATGVDMRDYQWAGEALLHRTRTKGGVIQPERKFGIDRLRQPTTFWNKQGWVRGAIDVTLRYDNIAEVTDYKSGKKKQDPAQLVMYGASTFLEYPEVDIVKAGYIWLKEPPSKAIDPPMTFTRDNLPTMIESIDARYAPVRHAHERDQFPPKKTGLCGWCDVETCEFWYVSPKKASSMALEAQLK